MLKLTMKRRQLLATLSLITLSTSVLAGGLTTNTNYHIAFDRMMARGATFEIDAIYSNPAGLAFTEEGFTLSFNYQNPHQDRDITATFPLFTESADKTRKFAGKATAPFVPGLFAAYRKDKFAAGIMVGIVGSGGYVKYDEGLPMFTAPVTALLNSNLAQNPQLAAMGINVLNAGSLYSIDTELKGKQYVYGIQAVGAYQITDNFSAGLGIRYNIHDGFVRGHVVATMTSNKAELVNMQVDCDQKGGGWTPQISLDYRFEKLTLSARYEFNTKIETENETHKLSVGPETAAASMQKTGSASMLAAYADGAKTRQDLPALFSFAVGYEFLPNLRAMAEFHHFDDTHASMPGDRQEKLDRGTIEYLAGIEWDINKVFTVSTGGQRTDYGLTDDFQQNTSFACDSYSLGFGGAVNIGSHLRLNASYFFTVYSDYTRSSDNYMGTGLPCTETFSRTNKVFGVGIDYHF